MPALHKLRKPINPYVFNVGVGDDAELLKIVQHMATVGIRSIGVVHWNEPSALEAVAFIEKEASRHGLAVTLKAPVETGTDHVEGAVSLVLKSAPAALIAILPVHATGALLRKLRQANNSTPLYAPSYTESSFLAQVAGGGAARGSAISQVVPNPFSGRTMLVREYQEGMRRFAPSGTRLSTLSLEGYIAAKILVQAMLRAGPGVTGPRLKASLETMQNVDLGGLVMNYDSTHHVALTFLDIAVVSADGRLLY
jgi:ABC-type branched-subunit amino acid transport system substrate-binding protein